MLKLKFIACTLLLCLMSFSSLLAQVPPVSEAQVEAKLNSVGTTDDEVRKRLLQRGIDVDNIDPSNPQQVASLEKALDEVLNEIEAEKKAELEEEKAQVAEEVKKESEQLVENEIKDVASELSDEVIEKVEEGATIQEAISEGIIEASQNDLPNSTIYGQHIFRNKEIGTYNDANDIVAPDSYILSAGDRISISLWGYSELDASYEVSKDGYIKPDRMARINLKGMPLGKAKGLLRSRFSNYYRFGKDQFEVIVTYPRTITVNIVGEVLNSGSFTMPAINTAFNALAAAGGPSDIGSVRNIKLIRPGGENRTMDVYEFLLDPTVTKDYYLQDNDIIFVEVAEKLVAVQGAVKRPFKYELKSNEQLKDLIKYAGGLNVDAYKGNFQIKRFIDDGQKIIDVNYNELLRSGRDFELKAGDEVVIGVIPTPYKNFVDIMGTVEIPGRYELEAGMKISDLIEKGVLAEDARTDVAYLMRTAEDGTLKYNKINIDAALQNRNSEANIALQPKDKLIIKSQKRFIDDYRISIEGAVRNPDNFNYDENNELRISDLVILADGLREDATDFAYVYRKDLVGRKDREYVKINLKNALENPESGDNLVLLPNDRVQVFSIYDYEDSYEISVIGAVRDPKSYVSDNSKKLKVDDIVTLSGGLKIDATDFAYVIRRNPANINENQYIRINIKNAVENPTSPDNLVLEPNDQLQVFSKNSFSDEFFVKVSGSVRAPGQYKFDPSLTLKDALTLSKGFTLSASSNRIDVFRMVISRNEVTKTIVATVEVDENLEITSKSDFQLQPFDHIVVRDVPEFELQRFVRIEGEVKYPGEYALLDNNEKITSLVKRAGGLSGEAFTEGATLFRPQDGVGYIVLRLDQAMRNKKNRHNFILKEGDVINIPKNKDIVTIAGATKAVELYPPEVIGDGKVNVAFKPGKRAKWYVDEYAAGIGEKGKKKLITVEHPNGEIKKTKNFLFFKVYPKVKKGSVVTVGVAPPKEENPNKKKREKIDWGKVLADSVSQATAVLSLILLLQRVD